MSIIPLNHALELFCGIFPRKVDYGQIRPEKMNIVQSEIELSGMIFEYFSNLYISDNAMIGMEFMQDIYSFHKSLTIGRQGWEESLERSWIPFGNRNGDVIFAKTETENAPVYGAVTGSFEPFLIADSLSNYIFSLGKCMEMEQNIFSFNTKMMIAK
jgi:hypothetical protein